MHNTKLSSGQKLVGEYLLMYNTPKLNGYPTKVKISCFVDGEILATQEVGINHLPDMCEHLTPIINRYRNLLTVVIETVEFLFCSKGFPYSVTFNFDEKDTVTLYTHKTNIRKSVLEGNNLVPVNDYVELTIERKYIGGRFRSDNLSNLEDKLWKPYRMQIDEVSRNMELHVEKNNYIYRAYKKMTIEDVSKLLVDINRCNIEYLINLIEPILRDSGYPIDKLKECGSAELEHLENGDVYVCGTTAGYLKILRQLKSCIDKNTKDLCPWYCNLEDKSDYDSIFRTMLEYTLYGRTEYRDSNFIPNAIEDAMKNISKAKKERAVKKAITSRFEDLHLVASSKKIIRFIPNEEGDESSKYCQVEVAEAHILDKTYSSQVVVGYVSELPDWYDEDRLLEGVESTNLLEIIYKI